MLHLSYINEIFIDQWVKLNFEMRKLSNQDRHEEFWFNFKKYYIKEIDCMNFI